MRRGGRIWIVCGKGMVVMVGSGTLLAERLLLGGKVLVRYHNWWVFIVARSAVKFPNTSFGFKGDKVRVGWLLAYTRGLATISCIFLSREDGLKFWPWPGGC